MVVTGVGGNVLIQLPQCAMQRRLANVGQHLLDVTHLNRHFGQMRGQQIGRGIAEHMERHQRISGQQLAKLGFTRGEQSRFKVGTFQIRQTRLVRKILGHGQGYRQRAPDHMQHSRLQR